MMNDDFAGMVEELASLPGITYAEIGIFFELNAAEFEEILKADKKIRNAFFAGRLKNKVEFAKKIVQLSRQGSGPAQTLLLKLNRNAEFEELRNKYA